MRKTLCNIKLEGLTSKELAKEIGINESHFSNVMNGRGLSKNTAERMKEVFKVRLSEESYKTAIGEMNEQLGVKE